MLITYKTNAHSPDHMGFTAQYEVGKLKLGLIQVKMLDELLPGELNESLFSFIKFYLINSHHQSQSAGGVRWRPGHGGWTAGVAQLSRGLSA